MAKRKRKPKKIRNTGKRQERINDTSPKAKQITPEEFAKAIGAELITDPEEIARFRRKFPGAP